MSENVGSWAETLTAKQTQAVLRLLSEPTIIAAAKAAKINDRTIYRWLEEPTFQAAYRAARRQVVLQTTAQLQQTATDAVKTLQAVMTDAQAPAAARVTAARIVLESAFKAVEVEDLAARVAILEKPYENLSQPHRKTGEY